MRNKRKLPQSSNKIYKRQTTNNMHNMERLDIFLIRSRRQEKSFSSFLLRISMEIFVSINRKRTEMHKNWKEGNIFLR